MDASTLALIIIGAVGAVGTTIAAITPFIRNWQKKRQTEAAKVRPQLEAAEASRTLSPRYEVAIKPPDGQTGDQAPDLLHLLVTFTGPAALGHLDRLTVALTPDRLPARLRASYRFRPGTRPRTDDRGADTEGRVSRCERVEGGEKLLFLLERTGLRTAVDSLRCPCMPIVPPATLTCPFMDLGQGRCTGVTHSS
jgi:hypothetical protein